MRCILAVTNEPFKRYVISPSARSPKGDFFLENIMNLFIYSDESGVFDKEHNKHYVYGGLILVGKQEQENASRKYAAAEKAIAQSENLSGEVKANTISPKDKNKLYRSLNAYHKFGVVIDQSKVLDRIFKSKKDKQRYLDFVYKIGVKTKFQQMIRDGVIDPREIDHLHFFVDEHTTATNGKYELREALEQEFKHGTYNWNYSCHFPPIFPNLSGVSLEFCNSATKTLVRSADIIANRLYHKALESNLDDLHGVNNMVISFQP